MSPKEQVYYTLQKIDINIFVDKPFVQAYEEASLHSGLEAYQMHQLWDAVRQAGKLPAGDLLEVGVFKGGSSLMILRAMRNFSVSGTLYACDTFQGLVKASDRDVWKTGEMAYPEEAEVQELLAGATVLAGIFPDETGARLESHTFRFAHIDVDIYQSAKDIWEWLWPRLLPQGIVIFDDCEIIDTPGITELISELEQTPGTFWLRNHMGQAVCVKF